MRILYGVCGEGMGHAIRSAVVGQHLLWKGHDVQFVSAGGAHKYLSGRFPNRVTYVLGLNTVMDRNTVLPLSTLMLNIAKMTLSPLAHVGSAIALGKVPDAVVSDFDPWSARYAKVTGLPLVAVDNIHFMNRCSHPKQMVAGDRAAAALMYPGVSGMVPGARRYLVTTFASAPVAMQGTSLHLPILREKILGAPRSQGPHVVVYFNDKSDHIGIVKALQGVPASFRVYGAPGVTSVIPMADNVTLQPFSEDGFIADLASSRAVIGGAGFTLMTECIFLGKPLLAVPFGQQFEQILNANYLEGIGYGLRSRNLGEVEVANFLNRADGFAENLRGFQHDGNAELLRAVDRALEGHLT